ncbi:SIS domain-containing protein [Sphingosinithalassobacter portus]|uniref:SIS domain-containing protein n=1 Tax=Stakelama portus TaxID=2676234 RepID=UPI0030B83C81
MGTLDEAVSDAVRGNSTLMFAEAHESGDAVGRLLDANGAAIARIAGRLQSLRPVLAVTCGRGSSGHAGTFAKYLFESLAGVPTASAALSMASLYRTTPVSSASLCLAISQSGRSPDLLATVEAQRSAGAYVVALVNQPGSPLADIADETLTLEAGIEQSVAATKSFITSLAAVAAIVAAWTEDADLADGVRQLPTLLHRAFELDWSPALPLLADASNLFVIGRGYGLGIAREMALKLQETAAIHAEAFSSAEVKHGPMALVQDGFPVFAFAGSGLSGDDVRETAALFAARGAAVQLADVDGNGTLPAIRAHPAIEPILAIQAFYRLANQAALARGLDPDNPPFLAKVTKTR